MNNLFQKLYQITRVVIFIAPFLLLGFLIKKDLVASGRVEFIYDFSKDSPVITNLFPANRLSPTYQIVGTESYLQQIEQEPVYFETRLPQKFDTADIEIIYKNQNQPLVQLGLRTMGESEWNYDFKPLENQLLDNLPWPKIEDERGTLWQRKKKFLSLDQFFNQLNKQTNFAAYNYPLERKFILPNYQPKPSETVINRTIRGAHSFYTYVKNEPLDFSFTIQDVNRQDGPDPLVIKVYNDQNLKIYEQAVEDDGYISKYDPASKKREIEVKINGLAEGVYRLVLDCDDEIFFRQIETKQQYLAFIDRLYLVDNPEYDDGFVDLVYKPTAIYSTIPRLGFMTAHPEGLQEIGINKEILEINEIKKNYYLTPKQVPAIIYLPKNDLKVFGRGLLALDEKMYFNPEIYNLRDLAELTGLDYLLTSYRTPQVRSGWKIGQVKFNLDSAKIINRKLRFVISAPELNSQNEVIPIKQIKVTLEKKPLTWAEFWQKSYNFLKNKF